MNRRNETLRQMESRIGRSFDRSLSRAWEAQEAQRRETFDEDEVKHCPWCDAPSTQGHEPDCEWEPEDG